MGFENKTGLGVSNYYGARDTGGSIGSEHTQDSIREYSIAITGNSLNEAYLPPVVLPKGALLKRATLRVDEAFTLTGTTPTLTFGAAGSVATNGIILTAAELQAIGTKVPASVGIGTWSPTSATGTTAAAKIDKVFSAGGAATKGVGKGTLTIEFYNKTKV